MPFSSSPRATGSAAAVRSLPCLAVIAALFAGSAAWGQECGVRNIMRLVNRVNGGTSPEVVIDTGWSIVAPLISPASASDSSAFGGSTSASWVARSDFGRLAFSGSGTGTNGPGNGLFMWLDADPHAQFRDRAALLSSSLPNGTPVSVRATARFFGTASSSDPSAEVSANAIFYAGPLGMTLNPASNQLTQQFTTAVGATFDASGTLNCTLRPYRILGGTVYTDTVQANISAEITFTVLTPGVTLSWCSNASYGCAADLGSVGGTHGGDGVLDNNDFIVFIDLFFSQSPLADRGVTGGVPGSDGAWDNNDFIVFIDQFFAGC